MLERIASHSRYTVKQLAREWCRGTAALHQGASNGHLIVTLERASGVVYSPVTNLEKPLLSCLNRAYAKDLVGSIREDYFFPPALEGHVRDLCAATRRTPSLLPLHHLLVLPIELDDGSEPTTPRVFDDQGREGASVGRALLAYLRRRPLHLAGWRLPLQKLAKRATAEWAESQSVYLLVRLENRFVLDSKALCRQLDLVQVGLGLASPSKVSAAAASIWVSATQTSSLAAIAALYERERYYERAARQCVSGSLVKHGPRTEIREQYDILMRLSRQGAIHIPTPDDERSDPWLGTRFSDSKSRTSWYRMPRLEMPSLSDTLLWKGGFQKYELGALMRATMSHMKQVYWGRTAIRRSEHIKDALLPPLLLARRTIEACADTVRRTAASIRREHPVEHKTTMRLYSRGELDDVQSVLDAVVRQARCHVTISWHDDLLWDKRADAPLVNVSRLCETVVGTTNRTRCGVINAVGVHGDAHFGNLLVDSSVPEDPLIISIDPKRVRYGAADVEPAARGFGYRSRFLSTEARRVQHDPCYDIAKGIVSTAGLTGLLLQRGLVLKCDEKGFCLREADDHAKDLAQGGGMSGARLIHVGTNVPQGSVRDHSICADALLREFQELARAAAGSEGARDIWRTSLNVSLVRLWAFSVRGLFSAANAAFPGDLTVGSALYVLACAFVQSGVKAIGDVIAKHGLEDVDARDRLMGAFRWYGVE